MATSSRRSPVRRRGASDPGNPTSSGVRAARRDARKSRSWLLVLMAPVCLRPEVGSRGWVVLPELGGPRPARPFFRRLGRALMDRDTDPASGSPTLGTDHAAPGRTTDQLDVTVRLDA